jgi:hypothetical protein
MGYFRELPDLEYQSPFVDRNSSDAYVRAKNLFRRVKLRDDLQNVLTLFNKYQIPDGARPDTVAEEFYGKADLDWVVILTAGIINVRNDWPLSDRDVYDYSEEIYGENLNKFKRTLLLIPPIGAIIGICLFIYFMIILLIDKLQNYFK